MNDYFAPVVKEFGYAAFIDELKPLIEQARPFDVDARKHDSAIFRTWRHKVADLTTKISRTHMDSDTELMNRQFRVYGYSDGDQRVQLVAFESDLLETLIELDHMVEHYGRYGEPKLRQGARKGGSGASAGAALSAPVVAPVPAEIEWPKGEKLTLYWLFKNMPTSVWVGFAIFVFGAFSAGVTVGNWPALQNKFARSAEPLMTAPTPALAASK